MPLDTLIFDPSACDFPKPRVPLLPTGLDGLHIQNTPNMGTRRPLTPLRARALCPARARLPTFAVEWDRLNAAAESYVSRHPTETPHPR